MANSPSSAPQRWQAGFSVVEALVAVTILATLAMLAVPAMADLAARQRLRGAADNLRADLQFARSEAVKRGVHVFVAFSPGVAWCYAVTLDAACGCSVSCASPDALLRQTMSTEAASGVELHSAAFAGTLCGAQECVRFDAFHGKALGSNGTALFRGAEGSQYKVIVAPLGRPRVCRASGDGAGWQPKC